MKKKQNKNLKAVEVEKIQNAEQTLQKHLDRKSVV